MKLQDNDSALLITGNQMFESNLLNNYHHLPPGMTCSKVTKRVSCLIQGEFSFDNRFDLAFVNEIDNKL
jgi:hypothetical protein